MSLRAVKTGFVAAVVAFLAASPVGAQGFAGPYLAATQADLRNDYDAAAEFYSRALLREPSNQTLLQSAIVSNVASARYDTALVISRQLHAVEPDNQVAALVEIADAFQKGDYDRAEKFLGDEKYRLNPLFAGLLKGWVSVGKGDYTAATAAFDALDQNDTLQAYGMYHKALALGLAGDFSTASTLFEGDENGPLHLDRMAVLAHVASLSQDEQNDRAITVINGLLSDGFADTQLSDLRSRLQADETIPFDVVEAPGDGAASVFGIIGSALARDDAERFGLIYARLGTLIAPTYDEANILAAEILTDQSQYQQAIDAYAQIAPESPWYISAEIGRAEALEDSDKTDQAVEVLSNLARKETDNLSVQTSLGDVQRRNENYGEAAKTYTLAMELIETETPSHWVLYYSRGISFEREKEWPKAEADFRHALELQPEQPQVMNYLGYSLVELQKDMEEAQGMIERAVAQRPQDGYITDSLGWVLYRVGKFEEAVPHMERAVELVPVDPVVNDHLGDVLWMVGRKLEARFQWRRALSFEPEEDEAERIRRKLEAGLDAVLAEEKLAEAEPEKTAQDG